MILARGVHESFGLIKGLGYKIYPCAKKLIGSSPRSVLAATLWSISRVEAFREVLATGKSECRILVDVLVAAAPEAQRPVDIERIEAMKPS